MTIHYLSLNQFGQRIGLSHTTMQSYQREKRLPEPDVAIGGSARGHTYGWSIETIDAWQASRPGRGKRAGLKNMSE